MKTFKNFFNESKIDSSGKKIIVHLMHLEDLLIEKGAQGIKEYINAVREVLNTKLLQSGEIKLSTKWDGSPAMFAGIDPDDGKFFISTKSINNVSPKLVKSLDDVKLFDSVGLQEKLREGFIELSKIKFNPKFIIQGDVIFTESDKKTESIDGQKYLTFTPNTLTYAVPVDNSEMYNEINKAKFGIVVHSKYTFEKNENRFIMSQTSPNFDDLIKQSKKISTVFLSDPTIKGKDIDNIDFYNRDLIEQNLKDMEKSLKSFNKKLFDQINEIPDFLARLQVFINAQLDKSDMGIFGDAVNGKEFNEIKFFKQMKETFFEWWEKQILKLKSKKGIDKKKIRQKEWLDFIDNNIQELTTIFKLYYLMIKTKNLLMSDLEKIELSLGKAFVKDTDGSYKSTSGEGMVLISKKNTIKLVSRIEFSRLNRIMSANR